MPPARRWSFEGEFYTHTLMAPFFNPGPNPHGNPKILLAGVGPLMTETAGEVADGFLSTRSRPSATCARRPCRRSSAGSRRPGARARVRDHRAVVDRRADTEEEIAAGIAHVKQQIAFYGSTPAYRPVLELHGWGDLQDELQARCRSPATGTRCRS